MQKIRLTNEEFQKLNNKELTLKGKVPVSLGDALFVNKDNMNEVPAMIHRWEHTETYKSKHKLDSSKDFESVTEIKFSLAKV